MAPKEIGWKGNFPSSWDLSAELLQVKLVKFSTKYDIANKKPKGS